MKRLVYLLLLAVVVLVGAYAWSPAFRGIADRALPGSMSGRLASALTAAHLMSGGPDAHEKAPAERAGRRGTGPVAVSAAVAVKADMPILEFAIGYAQSPAVVSINSRVTSQVEEQHVAEGQEVRKGDLLFTLDDRALKAQLAKDQATLAKDEALQASAEANLERARRLFAQQTASKQALDQAVADQKTTAANVAADNATIQADELQIGFTRITAPISGRLGAIQVHPGDLVNSGTGSGQTPLVTITQMRPMRVSFAVSSDQLPALRKALAAGAPPVVNVYAPGDYGLDGNEPLAVGKLDFVNSSVDTASGNIVVKAVFPNEDEALWPGQYVNVVVEAGVKRGVTTVPTVAVQQGQSGPFVFVIKDDNTAEIRPVTIALSQGDMTGLESGLEPGERVVIEGQLKLKDGTHVSVKQANAGAGASTARPTGTRKRT